MVAFHTNRSETQMKLDAAAVGVAEAVPLTGLAAVAALGVLVVVVVVVVVVAAVAA